MHDETHVMNDEDNANDEVTNGIRTRLKTSTEHS